MSSCTPPSRERTPLPVMPEGCLTRVSRSPTVSYSETPCYTTAQEKTLGQRTVVITGAGQGLGAAIAENFASKGEAVVVTDVNEAAAAEVAGKICLLYTSPSPRD